MVFKYLLTMKSKILYKKSVNMFPWQNLYISAAGFTEAT